MQQARSRVEYPTTARAGPVCARPSERAPGGDPARKRLAGRRQVDYLAEPGIPPEEGKTLGSFSLTHWIVVLLIVMILFGAGKLPRLMGDLASGIKVFKRTMNEGDTPEAPPSPPPTVASDQHRPIESQ
jgi:sec-independent protein translocase protein TatA